MRGAVILVIAALGVAALGSMLLWVAPRMFRRRPPSFKEQLAAVSPRRGGPVGPAGGVGALMPMDAETPADDPGPTDPGQLPPGPQATGVSRTRAGPAGEDQYRTRGER